MLINAVGGFMKVSVVKAGDNLSNDIISLSVSFVILIVYVFKDNIIKKVDAFKNYFQSK